MISPVTGETENATIETIVIEMVMPISGMNAQSATTTPRASEYWPSPTMFMTTNVLSVVHVTMMNSPVR